MKIKDKQEFIDLYVNQQWSAKRLAMRYDASDSTIYDYAKRHGISRPKGNYDTGVPDRTLLRKFYVQDGMTLEAIGDRYGVTSATVFNWLKRYQIPRRKGGAILKFPKPSKTELENKYIKHKWEQGRIAYHFGCSLSSVQRWLREYGIRKYVQAS